MHSRLLTLLSLLRLAFVASQAATGTITVNVASNNVFQPQCQNGKIQFQLNAMLSVTVQKTGGAALTNQPMAETVLDTATMKFAKVATSWFVDGVATPVTVQGGPTSTTTGNIWTFALADDAPNLSAQIALTPATPCVNNVAVKNAITASFASDGVFINGAGAANLGIPPVAAVPTIANKLQPANIQAGAGQTATTTATSAKATTVTTVTTKAGQTTVPTVAPTTNPMNGKATGTIQIIVSANQFNPQCLGGQWTLSGQGFTMSGMVQKNGGQAVTLRQPMGEWLQDSVSQKFAIVDMAFFLNGKPATTLAVTNVFNAGGVTVKSNVFSFGTQNDIPNVGGNFAIGPCTQGAAAPTITVSLSSATFINAAGSAQMNIPAVSAVPTLVNKLAAANQQNAAVVTAAPTAAPTTKPATDTTVPTDAVTDTQPTVGVTDPVPTGQQLVGNNNAPAPQNNAAAGVAMNSTVTIAIAAAAIVVFAIVAVVGISRRSANKLSSSSRV